MVKMKMSQQVVICAHVVSKFFRAASSTDARICMKNHCGHLIPETYEATYVRIVSKIWKLVLDNAVAHSLYSKSGDQRIRCDHLVDISTLSDFSI